MADNAADPAVVEQIAEEFLEQHRQGKSPSVDDFCDRYPEHADELRGFLPALVAVEVLKPNSIEGSGPTAGVTEIGGKQLERLGDYRILAEVGRGGMGVVYEAEQESLGRRVALKVLAQHLLNESRQVKRFLREARAAAKLHHTNIVPVFGVGEQNGHHYYVMQFIQGLGLDEVLDELRKMDGKGDLPPIGSGEHAMSAVDVARSILKERRDAQGDDSQDEPADSMEMATVIESDASTSTSVVMPGQSELSEVHESEATYWDGVARIGIQVAEALEHAHEQGTLHRDIKPSNLLLDGHGQVWVTDFGLAKVAEADDLTHTGDILGTIRYMAPERFHGQCDARTDIYSLGITLYELLARRPAYLDPAREQLIKRIESAAPTPLSKTTPGIPRDLETIVNKAIEKDAAHRYRTAQDLADDLQRFVNDEPIHARRISVRERFVRWARRNPVVAGSVSVAAAALILVAVLSFFFAQSQAKSAADLRATVATRDAAITEREDAITDLETALERLEAAQSELKIESARLALEKGHGLMEQEDAQTALAWYARALSQVEGNADAVHLEQFIRRGISASQSHLFALGQFVTPQVESFEVSPDGRFVVTRAARPVAARDPLTGRGPGFPRQGAGGFGGGRAARPEVFTLWDMETGSDVWSTERTVGGNRMSFSPDSRFLLIGGRAVFGGRGRFRDAVDETPVLLCDLTDLDREPQQFQLPQGFEVLGINRGGTTVLGIRRGSTQRSQLSEVRPCHFDIASETEIPFAHAVSVAARAPQSQPGFARNVVLASVSATRLVTSVTGAEMQVWQRDDPAAAPETLTGDQNITFVNITFVKLTPDGRHVLIGDGDGRGLARLIGRSERIHCLPLDGAGEGWSEEITTAGVICDFTPDGGRLLLIESDESTRQQRLSVRSTATGRLLQSMALPRVVGSATGGVTGRFTSGATARLSAVELRCHPDGRSVLLSTTDGVRQFELPGWTLLSATVPESAEVTDFGFYKGGSAVYAFSADHVRLHDLASGATETIPMSLQFGRVADNGGRLVGSSENADDRSRAQDVSLRIVDLAGATTVVQEHRPALLRDGGFSTRPGTRPTGLSEDGRHFMTAVTDEESVEPEPDPERGPRPRRQPASTFHVHDGLTGNVVATLESRQQVGPWCVSPSTNWMARRTRINQVLPVVVLTDLRTGESVPLSPGRGGTIGGLAFSNDEHWLVCASGTQFAVFDLHDSEFGRILTDTGAPILDIALSPDNRTVLVLERGSVVSAWDIESGHSFSMTLDCAIAATEFAISPDGTRLATLHLHTSRSQVRVWEMPAAIKGGHEQIATELARQTGIRLDGRGVRELSVEQLKTEAESPREPDLDLRWHQARAIDEIDQRNWRSALWHLKRWVEIEPDSPRPHTWMAWCHIENGDLDECRQTLAVVRSLTREPDDTHTALVPVLLEIELVRKVPNEDVLEHLEHQLQLDPTSLTSILRKSWIEANMRRWDNAIHDRKHVVEHMTDDHSIQLELAAWYLAADQESAPLVAHLESMLELWESTSEPDSAASAALAALLAGRDSDLHERAFVLVDNAVGNRRNARTPAGFVDAMLQNFDNDGDEELSPNELRASPFLWDFLGFDRERDTNITRDELAAAYEQRLAARNQLGSQFTTRPTTADNFLLARGIADYRREDWAAAHEYLTRAHDALVASRDESEEVDQNFEPIENARIALTGLFLAMTEHRRGNTAASDEQLADAQALLDAHVDDPTTYDSELEWWIFAREVLKEAEETLGPE